MKDILQKLSLVESILTKPTNSKQPSVLRELSDPVLIRQTRLIERYNQFIADSEVEETINPETLQQGFEQRRDILGGKYYLLARAMQNRQSAELFIYAYSNTAPAEQVGSLILEYGQRPEDKEEYLTAKTVDVKSEHRGTGVAFEMYKFANDLGNDILPSSQQTEQGRAMWKRFGNRIRQPKKLGFLKRFF